MFTLLIFFLIVHAVIVAKKIRLTVADVFFLSHMCDILKEMSCFPWEFFTEIFLSVRSGRFPSLCNTQKVDLDLLEDHDNITLKNIIQDHFHYTIPLHTVHCGEGLVERLE